MKRPPITDLETASMWLECNEGEGGESDACARVAKWLDAQIAATYLRAEAKAHRMHITTLRTLLKIQKDTP
jgi:hypothetical protein